jgi:hypothetical protein
MDCAAERAFDVTIGGTSHLAEQFTPIDDDEWLSDGAHGRG